MPRYYAEFGRGYDLTLELPFLEADGKRYQLASAGSLIWCCKTCAAQHFRDPIVVNKDRPENCYDGHGPMTLMCLDDLPKWHELYEALGIKTTTPAERKALRLEDEVARPWNWVFGDKTEADFPEGYVKSSVTAAAA
jgi:hypothetical protein